MRLPRLASRIWIASQLLSNRKTYATGLNDKGQLGVGDLEDRNSLTLVIFPQGVVAPEHISAAGSHTLGRIE